MIKATISLLLILIIFTSCSSLTTNSNERSDNVALISKPKTYYPITSKILGNKENSVHKKIINERNFPVKIIIPEYNRSASIYPVGLDKMGRMDTIPDAHKIGWYINSAVPSDNGNSLFAGHRDWKGELGSFRIIEKLKVNDLVVIEFENNIKKTFKVVSNQTFHANEIPNWVMDLNDGKERTTLITCAGRFVKELKAYQDRVIVVLKWIEKRDR